jgi:hypothetical protein
MESSLAPDGSLQVGAATPCARIYANADIVKRFPALIDSASLIGGIQFQSRASLGGNLCNSSPAADSIPTLIALGMDISPCPAPRCVGPRDVPSSRRLLSRGAVHSALIVGDLPAYPAARPS